MISKAKITGAILAMGAASVFALAPVTATAKSDKDVPCKNVGKSTGKMANNACGGKNSCKGMKKSDDTTEESQQ